MQNLTSISHTTTDNSEDEYAIQTKLYDGQRYQLLRYDLSFSSNFMFQKPL